jgi:cytochrome c peroxidase
METSTSNRAHFSGHYLRPEVAWKASSRGAVLLIAGARRISGRSAWLCVALLLLTGASSPQMPGSPGSALVSVPAQEPITPIPQPPPADPLKLALGASLFADPRLSHDGSLACSSCHDVHTNGADDGRRKVARDGSKMRLTTLSVFNAALSFRLNWEGNFRTLEAQAQSSLENPANMNTSVAEVLGRLKSDPREVTQFQDAYGHTPDRASLLDALATYERSLVTPGSRFDEWLQGDRHALTAKELAGYKLFLETIGDAATNCEAGISSVRISCDYTQQTDRVATLPSARRDSEQS